MESSISDDQSVPISRLTDRIVRLALVTAWRLAVIPICRSPSLAKATTLGVVLAPSEFGITTASTSLQGGHAAVGRSDQFRLLAYSFFNHP